MYGIDRRTIIIFIGVLLLLTLINLGTFNIVITLLTLPGVIIAMSFHEFAHAFAADKLGDSTPRNQGRLTLDPIKHIDPVGIFLLIFAHFGWGKPVQINPNNFSKVSREKGEVIVSLAGPLMNFILAFILIIVYYLMILFIPNIEILNSLTSITIIDTILTMVYYAIVVNIGLGVFNLIPIPPLDGSKIFLRLLPYKAQRWIDNNMMLIQIIFLVLFVTHILNYITSKVIGVILYGLEYVVSLIFSIFI